MFGSKPKNIINKEMCHLRRKYLEISFSHSLKQVITSSIRVTDQSATLIDCILTNLLDKLETSDLILT